MERLEKRVKRLKELFEATMRQAQKCLQLEQGTGTDDICKICDSFAICRKVFFEERQKREAQDKIIP